MRQSCSIIRLGVLHYDYESGGTSLNTLWEQAKNILWNVFNRPQITDILDILIVAFLLYQVLMLTRQTRASAVLKGFLLLIAASWVSDFFGLTALNWVLMSVLNNGAVVLVILFQPELRKALEQIGRGTLIESTRLDTDSAKRLTVDEIVLCLMNLSRRRVGALIVFEQKIGLKDVVEGGTRIDAFISAPLLENIFEPNTPLHDGAVVIQGDRVAAAGCILALSEARAISRDLGTRHRAAIGISDNTDAMVLIVSEETGIISMAKAGKLTRHLDAASLSQILSGIYSNAHQSPLVTLLNKTKERTRRYKEGIKK